MTFHDFLEKIEPAQASCIDYLDKQILNLADVTRKMRYGVPFYDKNTWFCYLNPIKKEEIELCFMQGKEMKAQFPFLESKNRKQIVGFTINAQKDIDIELVVRLLNYSIEIID